MSDGEVAMMLCLGNGRSNGERKRCRTTAPLPFPLLRVREVEVFGNRPESVTKFRLERDTSFYQTLCFLMFFSTVLQRECGFWSDV